MAALLATQPQLGEETTGTGKVSSQPCEPRDIKAVQALRARRAAIHSERALPCAKAAEGQPWSSRAPGS